MKLFNILLTLSSTPVVGLIGATTNIQNININKINNLQVIGQKVAYIAGVANSFNFKNDKWFAGVSTGHSTEGGSYYQGTSKINDYKQIANFVSNILASTISDNGTTYIITENNDVYFSNDNKNFSKVCTLTAVCTSIVTDNNNNWYAASEFSNNIYQGNTNSFKVIATVKGYVYNLNYFQNKLYIAIKNNNNNDDYKQIGSVLTISNNKKPQLLYSTDFVPMNIKFDKLENMYIRSDTNNFYAIVNDKLVLLTKETTAFSFDFDVENNWYLINMNANLTIGNIKSGKKMEYFSVINDFQINNMIYNNKKLYLSTGTGNIWILNLK